MIRDLPNPDQRLAPSGTYPCELCGDLTPTSDPKDTAFQRHLRYHMYCSLQCVSQEFETLEKIIEDMDREIAAQAALIEQLKAAQAKPASLLHLVIPAKVSA